MKKVSKILLSIIIIASLMVGTLNVYAEGEENTPIQPRVTEVEENAEKVAPEGGIITTNEEANVNAIAETEESTQPAETPNAEQNAPAENNPVIDEEEPEVTDIYELKEEVIINKQVYGNVYTMGKKVEVNQTIITGGDLFVMGEDIEIKNTIVGGNIFALGQTIKIGEGTSAKSVYVCGQDIILEKNTTVEYSLRGTGSTIKLGGQILYDAYLAVDEVSFEATASVGRKLEYFATKEAEIPESVSINRDAIVYNKIEKREKNITQKILERISSAITTFITIGVFSLLFIYVDKKYAKYIKSNKIGSTIGMSILFGLLSFIAVPTAALILLVTAIGVKVAIAIALLFGLICLLASTATVNMISNVIFNKEDAKLTNSQLYTKTLIVGAIYAVVSSIPYLGGLVTLLFILCGIGLLIKRILYKEKEEK